MQGHTSWRDRLLRDSMNHLMSTAIDLNPLAMLIPRLRESPVVMALNQRLATSVMTCFFEYCQMVVPSRIASVNVISHRSAPDMSRDQNCFFGLKLNSAVDSIRPGLLGSSWTCTCSCCLSPLFQACGHFSRSFTGGV